MSFNFLKKLLNSDAIRNFFKSLKNIATSPTITTYLLIVPKETAFLLFLYLSITILNIKSNTIVMKKKFYILCVLLFVFSVNVFPDGTEPSGDGSEEEPYQVSTLNHLLWISTNAASWDKYFEQTADINASATSGWNAGAGFSPIGTLAAYFRGNYNGQNHSISGLTINRPTTDYVGMFGYCYTTVYPLNVNFENLDMINVDITGQDYVGGLVGNPGRFTVSNCSSSGSVIGDDKVGGLIGTTYYSTIEDCHSSCTISGDISTGGLIGYNYASSSISNCYSTGDISGNGINCGGLVGKNDYTINNCYSTSNINTDYNTSIGGLVGYNNGSSAEIHTSYSTGDLTLVYDGGGGLVGSNFNGLIRNCYSTGNVSRGSGSNISFGAFVGNNNYKVEYSYSTGSVYYTGDTDPTDKGFVGNQWGSYANTNNFWDSEASNQTTALGATAKTTTQMKTQSTFTDASWNFTTIWSLSPYYNNGYPNLDNESASTTFSWDGSESTAWNTGGNWSGGSAPNSAYDVVIANTGNTPIIASGVQADCNDLTINAGATLTVNSGGSLITAGSITNNGTFNYERSISNGQWHLISSPVDGAVSGMFTGDYLQTWDEPTATWSNVSSTTYPLGAAEGFGFWSDGGTTTHTFTGTPNTGDQSTGITNDGSAGEYDGANLLGNPYPSSIDWSGLDDTYGAIYYLKSNGTYDNWNAGSGTGSATQYVAPAQGFFIVTGSDGTFNVGNSDRTHNGATAFYKATNNIKNGLILKTPNGDLADELWVAFNKSSTSEFDFTSDAFQFFSGNNGISHLYSIANNRNLSIDIRPETNLIQLGFRNNENGVYQIGIKDINGISSAILEDTKTEVFYNLKTGNYEFAWNTSDAETRFKLHLEATGLSDLETQITQIFAYQKTINIHSSEKLNNAQLYIVDMIGRTVYEQALVDGQNESIPVSLDDGVYLVQLVSDSGTQVEKVILK